MILDEETHLFIVHL